MNHDVLAHLVFSFTTFVMFIISAGEDSVIMSESFVAKVWAITVLGSGIAYYLLLNSYIDTFKNYQIINTEGRQHIMIAVSLIIFGILMYIFSVRLPRVNKFLRAIQLLVIGVIFLFHNTTAHGYYHASWLVPYHRLISSLLIIGAAVIMFNIFRPRNKLLWIMPVVFLLTSALLAIYQDPYRQVTASPVGCKVIGHIFEVKISKEAFSPENINAKRCDLLIFTTEDEQPHQIALGEHEHHQAYPGFVVQPLVQGKSLNMILYKTGNYLVHDHANENIKANLSITD